LKISVEYLGRFWLKFFGLEDFIQPGFTEDFIPFHSFVDRNKHQASLQHSIFFQLFLLLSCFALF